MLHNTAYALRVITHRHRAQWSLLPADAGAELLVVVPIECDAYVGGSHYLLVFELNPIAVSGQGTSTIRAYLATTTAAASETTTPLLTSGAYTVAATHTTADGRETWVLTIDNGPTLVHSIAFTYGVINWVTRGVFLGSRRVYLDPQIEPPQHRPGGIVVVLSSNISLATVPASITVPAGSTSANFAVNTSPIGSTRTATITGAYNSVSKTAALH